MESIKTNDRFIDSGMVLIALHLLPGIIFAGFFFGASWLFIDWDLTGYLALLIGIPACLAPLELGVILLWHRRSKKVGSLADTIGYHQRGTWVDYIVFPLLLFICWGILSIAVNPIPQYIQAHIPGWLPAWATQAALINGLMRSSPTQRALTLGLAILLSGIVAPLVEELYFRGFLLYKMKRWGWAAPVINSFLFAVYHFYFPENVPGIFVAFLPIACMVMVKKNWRIGLITHCMFNLWGVFSLINILNTGL